MLTLPNYFNLFSNLFSEDVINSLVSVEKSFLQLNYENHTDDIDFILNDTRDLSNKDLANLVMSCYREHINAVLSIQGIFLADPFIAKLSSIVQILACVTLLGILPVHELVDSENKEFESSSDSYFANIISMMSNLSLIEVLDLIVSVNPDVIDYLHHDTPIPIVINNIAIRAEERFRSSTITKTGLVPELIKNINKFGYGIKTLIMQYGEELSNIESLTDKVNQIILLVLGSDTPDSFLRLTISEIIEHIIDGANNQISANILVDKYFKDNIK